MRKRMADGWNGMQVYQKVILVFLILIVPFCSVNVWINLKGQTLIEDGLTHSNRSNAEFYSRQLDDQMAFIRNLQVQLLNDSDLQKLSFMSPFLDDFEEFELVQRVRERLMNIQDSGSYLVNAGVYVKSYGRTISTANLVKAVPNEESDILASYSDSEPARSLYYHEGKIYFIDSINSAEIIAYFELSVGRLQSTLSGLMEGYADSGAALVDDGFAAVVAHQRNDELLGQIREHAAKESGSGQPQKHFVLVSEGKSYLITHERIGTLGLTLYAFVSRQEITAPLKTINVWYLAIVFVSAMIVIFFSFSLNWMIHRPLKKLMTALKTLEADNLIVTADRRDANEFGYLYRSFDQMVAKLKMSIQEIYEQKIALQQSELRQLQAQINPHFLYNSFFNIYMISKSGDSDNAALLAQKLGGYFQFITRSGQDEVPVVEEYRHAMNYCEIQGIRFSNRITIEADELPEQIVQEAYRIPRLVVQPLIENAFEHAFDKKMRHGLVRISVKLESGVLRIAVEDNGHALTDDVLSELSGKLAADAKLPEVTGIVNVSRRLRLRFGPGSGVFVGRSELGGMRAEIRIFPQE